jgi:2-polyprenyl-3-methyl-5-hydroxy-6-metoxy-1,4-benzoquinol methylase
MASDQLRLIKEFVAEVVSSDPLHEKFIRASLESLRSADAKDLSEYLSFCLACDMSVAQVADCYKTIVTDTQAEQMHFMRNKKYRCSTFAEVADHVYFDADYMRKYMCGLAVTSFLWPNHNALHQFFLDSFPADVGGTYLEVGPGHGYYFMKAASTGQFDRLVGIDISPQSIRMTEEILGHFGIRKRYNDQLHLIEADFLNMDMSGEEFSVIVMGEVLEHVESPEKFLARLRDLCNEQTTLYVTTCANAPAIDHIYLFDSVRHVESMIEAAGLQIDKSLHVPYAGKTLEECMDQNLAVNVAYFLSRA